MASTVALAGLLGACGQKGPLYLPAKPQPAQTVPAPNESTSPASK